jgi:hypothetical protein
VRAKEPFEKIVKGKVQAPAKVNRTDWKKFKIEY